MDGCRERSGGLRRYLAVTYAALLVNHLAFLAALASPSFLEILWAGTVWLSGAALLAGAAFLPVFLLNRLLPAGRPWADRTVVAAAVLAGAALQGFSLLDRYVFGLYGFHLNGMVWNLVTTRGGLRSMDAGTSTWATFAAVAVGLTIFQTLLFVAVHRVPRLRRWGEGTWTRARTMALVGALALLIVAEKTAYAVSVFRSYGPVLAASAVFPLYVPVSCSTFFRKLGFKDERDALARMPSGFTRLNYPLRPIEVSSESRPPNVVWLVSESLRADMLDPEIMPATWAFAERSVRFRRHYSGGNGTRMGMFSMFYGLTGNYFEPCLAEQRAPVLLDRLRGAGFEFFLHTSAEFSFPELDKTVFAGVPRELLHEAKGDRRWQRDRDCVEAILGELGRRDPSRPFFTFMFFESPHAPYDFPEECAIRKPFAAELNYLTMDVKRDIGLIKNRYINAVRHLDTQLERLLKYLEESRLLESTIVLITGDHGEEFMEKGRWGHHSAFTEEQTRVPLVLHVPGVAAGAVDRLTSHLDLPATVLPRLGVRNPSGDYSLGFDLLGGPAREWAALSGWVEVAYVDDRWKSVLPVKSYAVARRSVTTRDDGPADQAIFMSECRDQLATFLQDLRRFQR